MDLILILIALGVTYFVAWFSYRVGQDSMARKYQSELASVRAQLRRVQRDLETAYDVARMRRGGAA